MVPLQLSYYNCVLKLANYIYNAGTASEIKNNHG